MEQEKKSTRSVWISMQVVYINEEKCFKEGQLEVKRLYFVLYVRLPSIQIHASYVLP